MLRLGEEVGELEIALPELLAQSQERRALDAVLPLPIRFRQVRTAMTCCFVSPWWRSTPYLRPTECTRS